MQVFGIGSGWSLGNACIDGEHAVQLGLLSALSEALQQGCERATARELLDRLAEFTNVHFVSEQFLMRLNAYPAYVAHVQEHDQLLAQLRESQERLAAGEFEATAERLARLRDRLLHHIGTEDRTFGAYLNEQAGAPALQD